MWFICGDHTYWNFMMMSEVINPCILQPQPLQSKSSSKFKIVKRKLYDINQRHAQDIETRRRYIHTFELSRTIVYTRFLFEVRLDSFTMVDCPIVSFHGTAVCDHATKRCGFGTRTRVIRFSDYDVPKLVVIYQCLLHTDGILILRSKWNILVVSGT